MIVCYLLFLGSLTYAISTCQFLLFVDLVVSEVALIVFVTYELHCFFYNYMENSILEVSR